MVEAAVETRVARLILLTLKSSIILEAHQARFSDKRGCGRPIPTLAPGQTEAEMLPDAVVMAMLKRELLLTRAKLHALHYEHIMGERKMRTYKSQLKQARLPAPRACKVAACW